MWRVRRHRGAHHSGSGLRAHAASQPAPPAKGEAVSRVRAAHRVVQRLRARWVGGWARHPAGELRAHHPRPTAPLHRAPRRPTWMLMSDMEKSMASPKPSATMARMDSRLLRACAGSRGTPLSSGAPARPTASSSTSVDGAEPAPASPSAEPGAQAGEPGAAAAGEGRAASRRGTRTAPVDAGSCNDAAVRLRCTPPTSLGIIRLRPRLALVQLLFDELRGRWCGQRRRCNVWWWRPGSSGGGGSGILQLSAPRTTPPLCTHSVGIANRSWHPASCRWSETVGLALAAQRGARERDCRLVCRIGEYSEN